MDMVFFINDNRVKQPPSLSFTPRAAGELNSMQCSSHIAYTLIAQSETEMMDYDVNSDDDGDDLLRAAIPLTTFLNITPRECTCTMLEEQYLHMYC